jgi:hypothetical protein
MLLPQREFLSLSILVVFADPGLNLRHHIVDHLLGPGIILAIFQNEIGAMEAPRYNLKRGFRSRLERASRTDSRRDARFSPWIKLSKLTISLPVSRGKRAKTRFVYDMYPLVQMRRVVLVVNQPPVHEFTDSAVLPRELPYV